MQVEREALETAVTLADQYIKTTALPAAAVQLMDRACALVQLVTQEQVANLPEVPPTAVLTATTCWSRPAS